MVAKAEKKPPQKLICRWALSLLLGTVLGIGSSPVLAADYGPWDTPPQQSLPQSGPAGILQLAITAFQRYISPVDGPRCSMYPTCSAYAARAIEGHGPLLGSFIFVDRLLHEGDPAYRQQPLAINGYRRFFDPLSANTFWLPGQSVNRSAPHSPGH